MLKNIAQRDLIAPLFVTQGVRQKQEIRSFPGVYRFSVDRIAAQMGRLERLGICNVLLFGVSNMKDVVGSPAYGPRSLVATAVREIKQRFDRVTVMTDVCLCAYTTHGHCGITKSQGQKVTRSHVTIDNTKTLKALAGMAVRHAEAGADFVAPSAMAKKQVAAIRRALDGAGFKTTKIMGYSAKFASNFYGPFREAARCAPKFGDRRGYQVDPCDARVALQEIEDDAKEGADIVMVKPALGYLDIVREAKARVRVPLAVYNVSGEYAMVKRGAREGLWDERGMVFEIMASFKRAGADLIITYHAEDIARWLNM